MNKMTLDHIEFYITNVCNLTCQNCRSFNNYKFSGSYKFDKENTKAWADKVHFKNIGIIGGEPTFHTNMEEWIAGIREAWPTSTLWLFSNGTRLSKFRNLHDILAKYNCNLQVSIHGHNLRELVSDELFLTFGECEILPIVKDEKQGVITSIWLKSSKGVTIEVQNAASFQDVSFVNVNFGLPKSDPVKAHDSCRIRRCHHMVDGKIYKCSVAGVLPSFLKQQNKSTDHLPPTNSIDVDSVTQELLDNLKNPMPFCAVCPESNKHVPIISILKKDMKFSKDTA
jgi:organic radical activating enzyme